MAFMDKKALLTKEELKIEKVPLNKGNFVFVRQMTAHEHSLYEQSITKEVTDEKGAITFVRSMEDFRAKLAVCTLCDEKGDLMFEPTEYLVLAKSLGATTIDKIATAALKLNRMGEEEIKNLEKN